MKGQYVTLKVTATIFDEVSTDKMIAPAVYGESQATLDLAAAGGLNVNALRDVAINKAVESGTAAGLFPKNQTGSMDVLEKAAEEK